jgi:ATP-binding protein involved in chromosome partitioning
MNIKEQILSELKQIILTTGNDILSEDLVASFKVENKHASVVLDIKNNLTSAEAHKVRSLVEQLVASHVGVDKATVVLTGSFKKDAPENQASGIKVESKSGAKMGVEPPKPKAVEGIKKIILVGSGKGGVGKSTVAANLAVALAQKNLQVGLLDADIYGPSVAKIMGLKGEPPVENKKIIPPIAHGVKCMSMGLILGENVPVVWRGPMVSKALQQLMYGADWGNLDVLIVDLPPGTGDIHLSIAQNFKSDGVIMVSTPQEVAMLDVKKAISMFEKVELPILGIVENMSYFIDPTSGNKTEIFGASAVEKFCAETGLKLLAKLPLTPQVAINADAGKPAVLENSFLQAEFDKICEVL